MKTLLLGLFLGVIGAVCAASSSHLSLDLDSASCRIGDISTAARPSAHLWRKFDQFTNDPDFFERSVVATIDVKFPEISRLMLWMDAHQLLKTACNLKRLHFLTPTLKEAYENLFFLLEFHIDSLNSEDTSRLWSCVAECGYSVPNTFFRKLDRHTCKHSDDFSSALVVSTLKHLSALSEGHAYEPFVSILPRIKTLPNDCDYHNLLFLKPYLTEVRGKAVPLKESMVSALESYQETAIYCVKTSGVQSELAHFLKRFEPGFACEVHYSDLDIHLDIANMPAKIVVDMDGLHHFKRDSLTSQCFRRHLDKMRDAVLLGRGWSVYRITPDQWDCFKESFAGKMTQPRTLETFYKIYAVNF